MWTIGFAMLLTVATAGAPENAELRLPGVPEYRVRFEDDQVRILHILLDRRQKGAPLNHREGVLIFLTTDLQGRMPAVEAVWRPAGLWVPEHPGPGRFEAVLVELKTAPAPSSALPPEADVSAYRTRKVWGTEDIGVPPYEVQATPLLDNEKVVVTRQRFGPLARVDLPHFHARDSVVVYLRRGEVSGATARWGRRRVERGGVDVLPPNTLHVFANMGSDPIEFITVHPK